MSLRAIVILIGFLAAFALGYFIFFEREKPITNYPSAGTDIIAFGDSLVAGDGSTAGNDFVSLLSAKLGEPIINLGVPGNTTADGLARVSELDRYRPKAVLLLLGGNDHLRRYPEAATFENLAKIIEDIHARGAVVLLLGVKGSLLGDRFEKDFEKLRDRYNTAYVPNVLEGLFGDTRYMSDTIHPNDAGYRIIADRIYPVLIAILR